MAQKLFLIYLFISINCLTGQSLEFGINHFSINDGLSNNTVGKAVQDSTGFVWIKTEVGLNRFDGYTIKSYFNIPGDSTSLQSSYINLLYVDKNNNLWVSTNEGVCRYNRENDSFIRYNILGKNNYFVGRKVFLPENKIYDGLLFGSNGMFFFNIEQNKIEKAEFPEIDYLIQNGAFLLHSLEDTSLLWFGIKGTGKIWSYNLNTKILNKYDFSLFFETDKNILRYLRILESSRGTIITTNGRIFLLNSTKNIFEEFYKFGGSLSIVNTIYKVFEDSKLRLWVGTGKGLYLLKEDEVFSFTKHNSNPLFRISSDRINNIFEDSKGRIHVLTFGGYNILNNLNEGFIQVDKNLIVGEQFQNTTELNTGEFILSSRFNGFNLLKIKERAIIKYFHKENSNSLRQSSVYSIVEDRKNNLWISTQDSGLCRLNRKTGEWSNIKITQQITAQLMDYNGNLWLGAREGCLKKYEINKNKLTEIIGFCDSVNMSFASVRSIFQLNKDTLLVGTRGRGLFLFNIKTNRYIRRILYFKKGNPIETTGNYSLLNNILAIERIDDNMFWIGTDLGFIKFDVEKRKIIEHHLKEDRPNSLAGNNVFDIYKDSYGQLWICTYDAGLSLFLSKEKGFKNFGVEEDFTFTSTFSIIEDNNRMLWFITTNGIMKIDPLTHEIKRYSKEDGFLGNEFNSQSLTLLSTGEIAAGGIDGLNIFHPNSLKENKNIPKIVITKFFLNNEEFKLTPDITVSNEIEVDYENKIIAFEFCALNYTNTEENQYVYNLEGLADGWIKLGNKRRATFTNLDPGEYVFRVKASNNDGVWNEEGISIKLIIVPPFWMTTWFRFLILIFAIIPIWIIFKLRVDKYKVIDETRSRIAENLHDEFGGKLSSIHFMSSLLQTKNEIKNNSEVGNLVEKISLQSVSIGDDFRDVVWSLNPDNDDWESLFIKYKRFASDVLDSKDINYAINIPDSYPKKELNSEKKLNYLLLIKEITNNIVKHSEASNVNVEIVFIKHSVKTIITDNGIGFDSNEKNEGNGISNIKKRIKLLNAEHQLTSAKDKGTSWKIILKF